MTTCTIKTVLNLLNLNNIVGQFFPALSSSSVGSWRKQRWSRNPVTIAVRQRCEPGLRAVLALLRGVRVARGMAGVYSCRRAGQSGTRGIGLALAWRGQWHARGRLGVMVMGWWFAKNPMTVLVDSFHIHCLRLSSFCMQHWPYTGSFGTSLLLNCCVFVPAVMVLVEAACPRARSPLAEAATSGLGAGAFLSEGVLSCWQSKYLAAFRVVDFHQVVFTERGDLELIIFALLWNIYCQTFHGFYCKNFVSSCSQIIKALSLLALCPFLSISQSK